MPLSRIQVYLKGLGRNWDLTKLGMFPKLGRILRVPELGNKLNEAIGNPL